MNALMIAAPNKEQLVAQLAKVDDSYARYLETLSPKKLGRVRNTLESMRHGLHTVAPLTCMGPNKCIFIEHCPIPDRTDTGALLKDPITGAVQYGQDHEYPIARPCVMESMYMQQKIIDYVQHLDVDPSNPVEMSIVNELALIDLLKNRALMILSTGDSKGQGQDLLKIDITNFDAETGVAAEHTTLHPAAAFLEGLEKRREKWLYQLVETRKAKIDAAHKMGKKDEQNAVLIEIGRLRQALETSSTNFVAESEVVEIILD